MAGGPVRIGFAGGLTVAAFTQFPNESPSNVIVSADGTASGASECLAIATNANAQAAPIRIQRVGRRFGRPYFLLFPQTQTAASSISSAAGQSSGESSATAVGTSVRRAGILRIGGTGRARYFLFPQASSVAAAAGQADGSCTVAGVGSAVGSPLVTVQAQPIKLIRGSRRVNRLHRSTTVESLAPVHSPVIGSAAGSADGTCFVTGEGVALRRAGILRISGPRRTSFLLFPQKANVAAATGQADGTSTCTAEGASIGTPQPSPAWISQINFVSGSRRVGRLHRGDVAWTSGRHLIYSPSSGTSTGAADTEGVGDFDFQALGKLPTIRFVSGRRPSISANHRRALTRFLQDSYRRPEAAGTSSGSSTCTAVGASAGTNFTVAVHGIRFVKSRRRVGLGRSPDVNMLDGGGSSTEIVVASGTASGSATANADGLGIGVNREGAPLRIRRVGRRFGRTQFFLFPQRARVDAAAGQADGTSTATGEGATVGAALPRFLKGIRAVIGRRKTSSVEHHARWVRALSPGHPRNIAACAGSASGTCTAEGVGSVVPRQLKTIRLVTGKRPNESAKHRRAWVRLLQDGYRRPEAAGRADGSCTVTAEGVVTTSIPTVALHGIRLVKGQRLRIANDHRSRDVNALAKSRIPGLKTSDGAAAGTCTVNGAAQEITKPQFIHAIRFVAGSRPSESALLRRPLASALSDGYARNIQSCAGTAAGSCTVSATGVAADVARPQFIHAIRFLAGHRPSESAEHSQRDVRALSPGHPRNIQAANGTASGSCAVNGAAVEIVKPMFTHTVRVVLGKRPSKAYEHHQRWVHYFEDGRPIDRQGAAGTSNGSSDVDGFNGTIPLLTVRLSDSIIVRVSQTAELATRIETDEDEAVLVAVDDSIF